jgi:hypothetical protein
MRYSPKYNSRVQDKISDQWEIVVWDWSAHTPKPLQVIDWLDIKKYADIAYIYARDIGGGKLKDAIFNVNNHYKYVHLIAHSAGVKLIDEAANELIIEWLKIQNVNDRPFIHLTFLDAYRPYNDYYGFLGGNYPHYSEHYVDVNPVAQYTNDYLPHAFNFDITNWTDMKDDRALEFGHQWPRRWYTRSVESPNRTGDIVGISPGFPLSLDISFALFCPWG